MNKTEKLAIVEAKVNLAKFTALLEGNKALIAKHPGLAGMLQESNAGYESVIYRITSFLKAVGA